MQIDQSSLEMFAARLLCSGGARLRESEVVASSLVDANLRGHDSHGVVRVPDYVDQLRMGELRSGAELMVFSETESLLAADAGLGFGQVQCLRLIDLLEPKARTQGIACGTLRNCGHVGRLGEWAERIAARGLCGLVSVNDNGVLRCVAPPGGIGARISTNPVAIGVPTGDGPLALDISTSAVANGKVKVAMLAGRQCPPGWLLDADGEPTTDPATRFAEPAGTLLPMGGEQGYKGFGLGLMLDLLCGGLSGGFCPPAPDSAANSNNVLMVLWDPALFAGTPHFLAETDKLIEYVRQTPRRAGVEAIRLPGDRGTALREQRLRDGIPLERGTWNSLTSLAEQCGVPIPDVRSESARE